jgi:predicted Zn-dependent peptidase
VTSEELQTAKEQLKGSYILGLESTSSRMNSNGKAELLLGKINTQEDVLSKIDAIEMNRVSEVIDKIFNNKSYAFGKHGSFSASGSGKYEKRTFYGKNSFTLHRI